MEPEVPVDPGHPPGLHPRLAYIPPPIEIKRVYDSYAPDSANSTSMLECGGGGGGGRRWAAIRCSIDSGPRRRNTFNPQRS